MPYEIIREDKIKINIEIDKDINEAMCDIARENGMTLDDITNDALRRHPIVEDRIIYFKNLRKKTGE